MKWNKLFVYILAFAVMGGLYGCDSENEHDSSCKFNVDCSYLYAKENVGYAFCDESTLTCQFECQAGYYHNEANECLPLTEDMIFSEPNCDLNDSQCTNPCKEGYVFDESYYHYTNKYATQCVHEQCSIGIVLQEINEVEEFSGICAKSISIVPSVEPELTEIKFPNLKYVIQDFDISDTQKLELIDAPNLKSVSRLRMKNAHQLTVLTLPSLVETDSIEIENAPQLLELNFPLLETTSYLTIQKAPLFKKFEFEKFKNAPETEFSIKETGVTEISMPNLETAFLIEIHNNPDLQAIHLPKLQKLTDDDNGTMKRRGMEIYTNSNLTDINIPELNTATQLLFEENNTLSKLELPALQKVQLIHIEDSNSNFEEVSINNLKSVETLDIHLSGITSAKISFDALETSTQISLGGSIHEMSFSKLTSAHEFSMANTYLTKIDIPFLKQVTETLSITGNAKLKEIHMPVLESVGSLIFENNPEVTVKDWKIEE